MRKIAALLLTVLFMTAYGASAADGVKLIIDGKPINVIAYNIKGNNYFKLRDIAVMLKETKAQFNVEWDENQGCICLTSDVAYLEDEGLTQEILKNPMAIVSDSKIIKDGAEILLAAYNIAGNNFFKLRDVAAAFDFYVGWNAEEQTIAIDTSGDYEFPDSTEFSLNPQYLSLYGMKRKDVERKFGTGIYEDDRLCYEGFRVKYDAPDDETANVVAVDVRLDNLFSNCPDSVTADMVKPLFGSYTAKENAVEVNYLGKAMTFYDIMTKYDYTGIDRDCYFKGEVGREPVQIINADSQTQANTGTQKITYSNYPDFLNSCESEIEKLNLRGKWVFGKKYYSLFDVDSDGTEELLVSGGYEMQVYTIKNGIVTEKYRFKPAVTGMICWAATYEGENYVLITNNSYPSYISLNTIKNGELVACKTLRRQGDGYVINGASVSEEEAQAFEKNVIRAETLYKEEIQ